MDVNEKCKKKVQVNFTFYFLDDDDDAVKLKTEIAIKKLKGFLVVIIMSCCM